MGNGPSTTGAGEQGQSEFVPRTHQQAVAHYQALGQMRGKRISSDEEFRPYSVGKAPHPSEKIWPTRVTHTPPGSPASQQISSSCRSKDAPRLYESLSLRNDFEILEELGASAEGTVYLGKHKRSGEVVALKTLKKKAVSMVSATCRKTASFNWTQSDPIATFSSCRKSTLPKTAASGCACRSVTQATC
jgi:hypothetical protein